jgi:hypothetical protein
VTIVSGISPRAERGEPFSAAHDVSIMPTTWQDLPGRARRALERHRPGLDLREVGMSLTSEQVVAVPLDRPHVLRDLSPIRLAQEVRMARIAVIGAISWLMFERKSDSRGSPTQRSRWRGGPSFDHSSATAFPCSPPRA